MSDDTNYSWFNTQLDDEFQELFNMYDSDKKKTLFGYLLVHILRNKKRVEELEKKISENDGTVDYLVERVSNLEELEYILFNAEQLATLSEMNKRQYKIMCLKKNLGITELEKKISDCSECSGKIFKGQKFAVPDHINMEEPKEKERLKTVMTDGPMLTAEYKPKEKEEIKREINACIDCYHYNGNCTNRNVTGFLGDTCIGWKAKEEPMGWMFSNTGNCLKINGLDIDEWFLEAQKKDAEIEKLQKEQKVFDGDVYYWFGKHSNLNDRYDIERKRNKEAIEFLKKNIFQMGTLGDELLEKLEKGGKSDV